MPLTCCCAPSCSVLCSEKGPLSPFVCGDAPQCSSCLRPGLASPASCIPPGFAPIAGHQPLVCIPAPCRASLCRALQPRRPTHHLPGRPEPIPSCPSSVPLTLRDLCPLCRWRSPGAPGCVGASAHGPVPVLLLPGMSSWLPEHPAHPGFP